MLTEAIGEDNRGIYKPLHKRFKEKSIHHQSFVERQEFSIKFACMILFALLLIFIGTLVSGFIQNTHSKDRI